MLYEATTKAGTRSNGTTKTHTAIGGVLPCQLALPYIWLVSSRLRGVTLLTILTGLTSVAVLAALSSSRMHRLVHSAVSCFPSVSITANLGTSRALWRPPLVLFS